MAGFKPLLAGKVSDTSTLPFPLAASPKLDGIRAVNLWGNELLSRNLKAIPNRHVQALFGKPEFKHIDGELICGDPRAKDCYRVTNSAVMSEDGEPDVSFFVFDHFEKPLESFQDRLMMLKDQVGGMARVVIVPQKIVHTEAELLALEEAWLDEGYEGVMLRWLGGYYKNGRSTDKECLLLKLKRFADGEAEVIGFEELYSNQNEATKDALGHTERSQHQEGMVPMNTLGALIVRSATGVIFKIGTGFTILDRKTIWKAREQYLGKIVKYKHFEIGVKDKPRFPVFLGFRDRRDM
jgi:DNA ligase-1